MLDLYAITYLQKKSKIQGGKRDTKVFSFFVHENDFLTDFKARDFIDEVLAVL